MDSRNQKENIKEFVRRWSAQTGAEEEQDRSFWIEFLQDCLGVTNATKLLDFQRKVGGRKIDVFYEDMKILIEQKGRGIDLDKPSVRSKRVGEETPFQQAKWYADNMPNSIRPDWIITCNFDEFRIYDLNHPENEYVQVLLKELPDQIHLFSFFTDKSNSRLVKEKELSVRAGDLVGELYKALSAQYQNIEEDAAEQRSLNILIVRLVFLLYAEDSGIFNTKQQFGDFLANKDASLLRDEIMRLFEVLDTPKEKRDPYLREDLAAFEYVNGGLFSDENVIIPQFSEDSKRILVEDCSIGFNWSKISPTIFGAAFESTLNLETRRSGGMHYTSIENIHKVINPLFLDDLRAELAEIEGEKVQKNRKFKLLAFQNKLASIKILDPAAGSGNFLTESFIQLRKLENRVLENLKFIEDANNPSPQILATEQFQVKVSISQFFGIEINDFAVSVAKTALWIAEEQMLDQTAELLFLPFDFLPLSSNSNIICTNALRTNWNDLLPAEDCTYIIGNPPFVGMKFLTQANKEDMDLVIPFERNKQLDYVSCWYFKAAEYMKSNENINCAFVSTNSICQGLQASLIWKQLLEIDGLHINFAYQTFNWESEASDKAQVHVIIVCISYQESQNKLLFIEGEEPKKVTFINQYLSDKTDVVIQKSRKPICNVQEIKKGAQLIDGGGFVLQSDEEKQEFISKEPKAKPYIYRYLNAKDMLNDAPKKYCLYLENLTSNEIYDMPLVAERVRQVRDYRANSDKPTTNVLKDTPSKFFQSQVPEHTSVVLPVVSSQRRKYIPINILPEKVVYTNACFFIDNATIYTFGVLSSRFHTLWVTETAGRMKSDFRYSKDMVYNTFPWPGVTLENIDQPVQNCVSDEIREKIENRAQGVLDVRASHQNKTLADLYDPDLMPQDLLSAHQALDAAVEEAYGVNFAGDEEKIVGHLFGLYEGLIK